MNIYLNNYVNFSSFQLTNNSRFKPIVYLISALAIGILLYQCYRHCGGQSLFNGSVEDIFESEELGFSKLGGKSLNQVTEVTFQNLIDNSDKFASHVSFPTQDNLIKNFATTQQLQDEVVEHAKGTRPIIPSRVWSFIPKILDYKKKYGKRTD